MKRLVSSGLLIGLLAGAVPVGTSFAMLPSKPDLTVNHEDNSCKKEVRRHKLKKLSENDREIFARNKGIVKKYRDSLETYKTMLSLMNDDELSEQVQFILCYFESFREKENWGREINEESLIKIKESFERFFTNSNESLIFGKADLKNAILQFFKIHSDWKIKRPVDDYRPIFIHTNEFEPDVDAYIFERAPGRNWGYNSPDGEFNINYIPSDSSDLG